MHGGWTATVALTGAAAFARHQAADHRAKTQSRLQALSRTTNLRHADDQSVAALAATLNAIGEQRLDNFRDWAIVAAPRAPGQHMMVASLERYATDGAWGVSTQIIPNYSLHSVSGLLSVALGITGPNIGVGGIPEREYEAFLAATSFLPDRVTPGVWIVMAGWHADMCRAVTLGLRPTSEHERQSSCYPQITLHEDDQDTPDTEWLTLESLYDLITAQVDSDSHCSLPNGLNLKWRAAVRVEAVA